MRNIAFVAVAIVSVLMLGAAQTRPNFEGTWRMDKSRSQYPAESAIEVIRQHGEAIDVTLTEKWPGHANPPMQLHLTTDGKPTSSTVGPNKFTSTTHLDHNKLVTSVQGDRGQHMTEIRELSSDGRELTVTGYHQDELTKPYYVRVMVRGQR